MSSESIGSQPLGRIFLVLQEQSKSSRGNLPRGSPSLVLSLLGNRTSSSVGVATGVQDHCKKVQWISWGSTKARSSGSQKAVIFDAIGH